MREESSVGQSMTINAPYTATSTATPTARRSLHMPFRGGGGTVGHRLRQNTVGKVVRTLRRKLTAKPVHDKSIRSYFEARRRAVNTLLDTSEVLNGNRPDADARLIQAVLTHDEPKTNQPQH
ncbi:hypothetical protein ACERK3_15090 [Phycisphaerales bacterium AB-hyl4]|uniref:Uncharacterized protein n=1 Tax=Natronomicrosphaera hydrolytica TaxID=3242702 RepID=A0ABV4U7M3_9BACT